MSDVEMGQSVESVREPERRDDLDPLTRAVSDTLDELLFRHHGINTSWSNPESFIKWLRERGYTVVEDRPEPTSCSECDVSAGACGRRPAPCCRACGEQSFDTHYPPGLPTQPTDAPDASEAAHG